MEKQIAVVGIDLAKNVFHVHAVDAAGHQVMSKSVRRSNMRKLFSQLPTCLIGMEACGSSHYWARELQQFGHEVRLMAPQYVKPYVKTNKNDAADAEAICEAVTRPNMRYVGIKSPEQQAILLIHREREGLVKERTALINRIRSTLAEFGIAVPTGPHRLKAWFRESYGCHESVLPPIMNRHVQRMMGRLFELEKSIFLLDEEIDRDSRENEACQRLAEIPGIGRLTASAMVASIGDGSAFANSKQFSAWLGIVPKQHSSGGKQRLLGISKRGDAYLRRMLIHGARAVIRHMNPRRSVTPWLQRLINRAHKNVVIVALANKLARIAWAILVKKEHYQEVAVL